MTTIMFTQLSFKLFFLAGSISALTATAAFADGLTLPFSGSVSSNKPAFRVESLNSTALYGYSNDKSTAIAGHSLQGTGVIGTSNNTVNGLGVGVKGNGYWGLYGETTSQGGVGVFGRNVSGAGVAVKAESYGGIAVLGTSSGIGVYGLGSPAGFFSGNVVITNDLQVKTIHYSSDRNLKVHLQPVNGLAILQKLSAIPITTWNYKASPKIRHLGPMAQDFYAAFNLGEDNKHISLVDAQGVSLAAIQALYHEMQQQTAQTTQVRQQNQQQQTEIAQLRQQVAALKQQASHLASVEAKLAQLERLVEAGISSHLMAAHLKSVERSSRKCDTIWQEYVVKPSVIPSPWR